MRQQTRSRPGATPPRIRQSPRGCQTIYTAPTSDYAQYVVLCTGCLLRHQVRKPRHFKPFRRPIAPLFSPHLVPKSLVFPAPAPTLRANTQPLTAGHLAPRPCVTSPTPGENLLPGREELLRPRLIPNKTPSYWQQDGALFVYPRASANIMAVLLNFSLREDGLKPTVPWRKAGGR